MANVRPGGEALADRLTEIARRGEVKPDNWHAQLSYLTGTVHGRELASQTFGKRNLVAWLRGPDTPGGRAPSPANQDALQRMYRREHTRNVGRHLKTKLNNHGKGTVVEVHPDPAITEKSKGGIRPQTMTITDWNSIIDSWLRGDMWALQIEWEDLVEQKLYSNNPRAYYTISHLGFG